MFSNVPNFAVVFGYLNASWTLRADNNARFVCEVLNLMAEGLSNGGIAERLVISNGAVEKHISNVFMKLDLEPGEGAHRRVLAVLRYLRA